MPVRNQARRARVGGGMSITKEIARLREKHWLEVRALLGDGHDYESRDTTIEGIVEQADAYNYWKGNERTADLAEEAAELGDRAARRKGLIA